MSYSYGYSARFTRTCPPDCELRKPGCHDHCERFQAIKKQNEELKEKIKQEKYKERLVNMKTKRDRKR